MHHRLSIMTGTQKVLLALSFLALAGAAAYLLIVFDLFHRITALVNETTPPLLFVGLMAVLPMAGIPLTLFLLFLGTKFGMVAGLLILEAILPLQMAVAYVLAHAVRRPLVYYLVNGRHYRIPVVPAHHQFMFSFFFITFPGFPYAVKLYLLPLAGVRFRYCVWLNWALNGLLCIPFVLLGKSAMDLNMEMFAATLVIFIVLFVFLRWAKKRYLAMQVAKTP